MKSGCNQEEPNRCNAEESSKREAALKAEIAALKADLKEHYIEEATLVLARGAPLSPHTCTCGSGPCLVVGEHERNVWGCGCHDCTEPTVVPLKKDDL